MPRESSPTGLRKRPTATIRGVLLVGFAAVFGLWVLSGFELVRRLQAVEQRVTAEHASALQAERLLSTVRTNVLLGSIYLRDALIDNRPVTVDYYRGELDRIRENVDRLLQNYVAGLSPEERREWSVLLSELDTYWKSRELVFRPGAPLNTTDAAAVLRRRVVPNRNAILQITDRLSELQSLSQRRHEAEVSEMYAGLRDRLLLIGAMAIVLGLIVAGFATRNVGRLERQIEEQRIAERHTRQDLERLSARLVNVQEQERRSLARELHDEVGQALTAIKMDVAVALLRAAGQDARVVSSLEDARSIAENTLQVVRDLSQLLHPSMLDDFGLPETLRSYLRSFSKRTGVRAQFTQEGMEHRLPPEHEVCIYRIAQEALTNVTRHSGARNVSVSLVLGTSTLRMTIDDDGRGFSVQGADSPESHGLGIIGMRERAQALGGTFAIVRQPAGGTRVEVRLPAVPTGSAGETAGMAPALAG